ncbi:phage tail protein [Herbivorax sp. ANBcel31]|uniref:phage tail protein n=1 Tax=Herbivorax sp. ANBcel31 TaxID=3069754 RepID=UPI0027B10C1C|nr:phage tail protein [Herbivorax sp. ANBcel31]MDQ2085373.1 phage tail protein [Herbivorax sp. ANBcel31]
MGQDTKFFSLNGYNDLRNSFSQNIKIMSDGSLELAEGRTRGTFIWTSIDSREKGMSWYRILVDGYIPQNDFIKLSCYVNEKKTIFFKDKLIDIDDWLLDDSIKDKEKMELFEVLDIVSFNNAKDVLINNAKGRYLWIKIELTSSQKKSPIIRKIRAYYDVQSFVQYLPEIYQQENDSSEFLERFLGIFQSLYLDMEEKIDNISNYFDPECVYGEFLNFLADWVGIDDVHIWDAHKLKALIKTSVKSYKTKGTKESIEKHVELYTTEKPYIIEHFQIKKFNDIEKDKLMKRLYSDSPYIFTVIVKEQHVPGRKEYSELKKIIDSVKPAHTQANLVVLKPLIHLGNYSYLGINSYLERPTKLKLDGYSTLTFNTMLGG